MDTLLVLLPDFDSFKACNLDFMKVAGFLCLKNVKTEKVLMDIEKSIHETTPG